MTTHLMETMAAQGDVLFRRVAAVPPDARAAPPAPRVVVAHSETGHDHVLVGEGRIEYLTTRDPLVCYLRLEAPTRVEHLRPFDTHAPLVLAPGVWQVRRQREYTPDGYRRVED